MLKPLRLLAVLVPLLVLVGGLFAWGIIDFGRYPQAIAATKSTTATGAEASITLQTVSDLGNGAHPDWVSYLIKNPNGQWVHTTMFQVPANALVHVTIQQYDTGSDLRNRVMLQPQGVVGAVDINGKPNSVLTPAQGDVGHTFTIPQLGVSVPLEGVPDNAKNPCPAGPCTTNYDHNTVTFAFHTGAPGLFHWQCFVPCGTGFLDGNGGPMGTLGYMGGFMKVVG